MGRSRRHATSTAPAQTEPCPSCQAELVICDKTIERAFGWLNRARRLAKDFEECVESSATWIYLTFCRLLLRRLTSA